MNSGDKELRQYSGYGIKRAFNAVQSDLNATLEPLGLRLITFSVLSVIVESPGLRQSQLAELLSIERPNLVLILDELEGRDLILRQRAADDRRAYALKITLSGRQLFEKAKISVDAHEVRMTSGLHEAERLALISALRKIEINGLGRRQDEPAAISAP